ARMDVRVELEERVDRHQLDAGRRVDLGGGDDREDTLEGAGRARVAIGDRLLDQAAGAVEEAVVDAPGVDADRSDARAAARGERLRDLAQRRDDLGEEVARAPAQGRRPALVRRLD